jgi:hypothetical protein
MQNNALKGGQFQYGVTQSKDTFSGIPSKKSPLHKLDVLNSPNSCWKGYTVLVISNTAVHKIRCSRGVMFLAASCCGYWHSVRQLLQCYVIFKSFIYIYQSNSSLMF